MTSESKQPFTGQDSSSNAPSQKNFQQSPPTLNMDQSVRLEGMKQ